MTKIFDARPLHVFGGSYTVEACLDSGGVCYHNGPSPYPYFTAAQAMELCDRINRKGVINLDHWHSGRLYESDDERADNSEAMLEREMLDEGVL